MNKQQFLSELTRELQERKVPDVEEILADYEEHFACKLAEGRAEEEICRRLGLPADLAEEYGEQGAERPKSGRAWARTGVVLLWILFVMVDILMWAAALAVIGTAVCSLALGIFLLTSWNPGGILPAMPYWCAACLAVAAVGLAMLSGSGSVLLVRYVDRFGKVFARWGRKVWNGAPLPSASLHPSFRGKAISALKLIAVIGTLCFVIAFAVAYVAMCVSTGSMEPWHVWNWFV